MTRIYIEGVNIISDNARHIPIIRTLPNGKHIPVIVTSPEYRRCKEDLIRRMLQQAKSGFEPYTKNIMVKIKAWSYKDGGNIFKVLVDALEGADVIDNDRNVLQWFLLKIPVKRGTLDTVDIEVEGER